jgi:tRNA A37 methylthiotransferase MiaB
MPQLQKSIIKQRAQKLRQLGEELLDEVKKEFYLPRKVLIEEVKTGAVVGYDQNYIKHQIPMIGLPIGEIVTA